VALGLSAAACSSGGHPEVGYTGLPFDPPGDDGAETDDAETGIDLDGGAPPPPPGGDLPPGEGRGDCCVGHDTPGCDNKPVEQCVCAADSWCCESEWDDACADLIEQLGCGHCTTDEPPGDTSGEPPPPPPDGETSGDEPAPPEETSGGEPPPGDGGGDCCTAAAAPGCADAAVEACVCMHDAYCCNTAWDGVCVDEVGSLGCGSCGAPGGGGGGASACCGQQAGAGCPDAAVEACVCAVDDYCCDVFWDLTCAGEVETLSCGSCG
jgi:hypothetical protein